MAKKTKGTPRKPRDTRKGLLPNQYRKRSTVYVERLRLSAEVDVHGDADMMITDIFNVITSRLDLDWTHIIEHKGETYRIPGKVIERIISQRESIIKEHRSAIGRATTAKIKTLADQLEDDMRRDLA